MPSLTHTTTQTHKTITAQGVTSPLMGQMFFRASLCSHTKELTQTNTNTAQGVTSPLMGQMFFRASLFGAFGESKRWLGKNADGSPKPLTPLNFYQVCVCVCACSCVIVSSVQQCACHLMCFITYAYVCAAASLKHLNDTCTYTMLNEHRQER